MSLDDIPKLLRRGGKATPAEIDQLTRDATEAKIQELNYAVTARTIDGPVKVISLDGRPAPSTVEGYITQERFLLGQTPEEIARVLGLRPSIDLKAGARIMAITEQLKITDFENKGYSYLPGGQPWNSRSKYPVGKGAGQWKLTRPVSAIQVQDLKPGQPYTRGKLAS
jgi:hypothetical protein